MLLNEHAATLDHQPSIQVFGTDLNDNAIQAAREAAYPETISADVSEERLRRFFTKGHGHYKVKREIREVVLFALHDLLEDSPFSRLDLIVCRNLLIYLNRDAQDRALDIFHFALRPEGVLFLGSSESVDENSTLFAVTDKKHRIYARRPVARPKLPAVFTGPSAQTQALLRQPQEGWVVPRATAFSRAAGEEAASTAGLPEKAERTSWSELHAQAIEQFGPPSVIVSREHDLMHLSGNAGRFLQFDNGEPTTNLLRVIHPKLRIELRAALFRATQSGEVVETPGILLELEGTWRAVDLRIVPSLVNAPEFLLVIFTEREPAPLVEAHSGQSQEMAPAVRELERELEQSKANLRDTLEQSEASQEELKASNEELQAMNEELRSTSEELETGREELQSINEELTTVNQEMKSKVEELSRSNGDLQNLMAATAIATVFLDRNLCIQRYTPPAVALFNLIPSDLGRPLSDLTPRLQYPDLAADAQRVLDSLSTIELEVTHTDGHSFLARLLPYRTAEDRIAGIVLTFVDITARRRAEQDFRETEARFHAVADVVPDLLWNTDAAGLTVWCNQRWYEYSGQTVAQSLGGGMPDVIHPEDRAGSLYNFANTVAGGQPLQQELRFRRADGTYRWFLARVEPLREANGRINRWFGAATDIEDLKRTAERLATSEERLRLIIENASEYGIISMDLAQRIISWNPGAAHIFGYTEAEVLGKDCALIFTPEDRSESAPRIEGETALFGGRAVDERWHVRKDGSRFWGSGAMMSMRDARGQAIGLIKILRDETEARQTREALEQGRTELQAALRETERARAEAEAAAQAKDHFLAVLSHELRTPLTPVLMAVRMLSRDRSLSANALDALEMIERNIKIEAHFIDDLLDLTRITRGQLEVVSEPMDVHAAVRHAVEITATDVQGKEQRITLALDAPRHELHGDATRLQQVFWNLLKNASKFTPVGGAIHLSSRNEPGRLIVAVADTGIGFEPETVARIFGAFEQASREVTQQYGGLGLGLAISKATVDAHGGTLTGQSAGSGEGATFTVALPLMA